MKLIPNETRQSVSSVERFHTLSLLAASAGLLLTLASGCASSRLNAARENFYLGRFAMADAGLRKADIDNKDGILVLMERGAIRQARGDYAGSTRDWVEATDLAERLDYLSISRSSASMVVNDRLLAFRGAPYERTLAHAFAAKSYMALGRWDDAAVEARNIIDELENLNGFPEEPYSRYLAGVCMEMISDSEGAALQYRTADSLLPGLGIDPATGRLGGGATQQHELVCFIGIGRGPMESGSWSRNYLWGAAPYAEVFVDGKCLGRSHTFSNTQKLMAATDKRLATLRAAKTAARVAIKEVAAQAVEEENELLGELLRLYLFALEASPMRRWETLPLWLQVARLQCPQDMESFEVVFRGAGGKILARQTVTAPLTQNGRRYVSFARAF